MILILVVLLIFFVQPKLNNIKYNSSTRDLLLFFIGIYGERVYICLDYLFSQIQIEKFLFLLCLYLIIITKTNGEF